MSTGMGFGTLTVRVAAFRRPRLWRARRQRPGGRCWARSRAYRDCLRVLALGDARASLGFGRLRLALCSTGFGRVALGDDRDSDPRGPPTRIRSPAVGVSGPLGSKLG